MDAKRQRLTTRTLLWAHVAAVTSVTLAISSAHGDLHAVQPPILQVLVLPAVLSLYLFPPLVLYAVFREPGRRVWSVVAEVLLLYVHLAVVSAGYSRWSGRS